VRIPGNLNIYPLAGIVPPKIRRYVATCMERTKQTMDQRHPMYITREPKGDLNTEEALLPVQPRSKIHQNNTEYENGERSYNVKSLARLLSIYHVEETNHRLYGRH